MTRLDAAGDEDVQQASDCDGPRSLRLEARDVPLGGVRAMEVRRILPRADRSKATVKVRVDFLARDEKAVLPEMGVRVRFLPDDAPRGVETGAVPDKIVVPKAAVQSVFFEIRTRYFMMSA